MHSGSSCLNGVGVALKFGWMGGFGGGGIFDCPRVCSVVQYGYQGSFGTIDCINTVGAARVLGDGILFIISSEALVRVPDRSRCSHSRTDGNVCACTCTSVDESTQNEKARQLLTRYGEHE